MQRQQLYVCILSLLIIVFLPIPFNQGLSDAHACEKDIDIPLYAGEVAKKQLPNEIENLELSSISSISAHAMSMPPDIQDIVGQINSGTYGNIVRHLSINIGSRLYDSAGNDEAVDYVADFFSDAGLAVSFHEFGSGGPNVIGILPGASTITDQCIVIGAHLDTIPGASPGADDNASGVAAVLEIARVFAQYQFDYTLIFVAFNAEELGLFGSNAYAYKLVEDQVDVALMVNFDMILWDNPSAPVDQKIDIIHNDDSKTFANEAADFGQDWLGAPVMAYYGPGMGMSDHSPFWSRGFPAVWFFEHGGLSNPYIHSAQDSISQSDYSMELGATATRVAAAALADYAHAFTHTPGFPNASFVAPKSGGFVNPDIEVPITLSVQDEFNDVTHIELSIDGGNYFDITSGFNGTHCVYPWTTPSEYGIIELRARVYDAAGWIRRVSSSVTVDSGVNCQITAPILNEEITQGTQYMILVNASDLDVGGHIKYVQVRINQSDWMLTWIAATNIYYYNWTAQQPGEITIQARACDANGRHNSSLVTVTVLHFPPIITAVSFTPPMPLEGSPVSVSAQVTQDIRGSGINYVLIVYSVNGAPWSMRRMALSDENTYFLSIGPFPANSHIRFYIQASDNLGNIAIDDNAGQYYQFVTGISLTLIAVIGGGTTIIAVLAFAVYFLRRKPNT